MGEAEYLMTFGALVRECEGKFIATLLEVNPSLFGVAVTKTEVLEESIIREDQEHNQGNLIGTMATALNEVGTAMLGMDETGMVNFDATTGLNLDGNLDATGAFGGALEDVSEALHSELPQALSHIVLAFLLHQSWMHLDLSNVV